MVKVGSRFDLRTNQAPDAPETEGFEGPKETHGWVHSYETGSTVDGPGVRVMLFMSGCFLRCQYCHNPDTWHLKDGTKIELSHAIRRLRDFAPALRAMGGGLTISGGEPLVQIGFTRGLFSAAKQMGLHTALDTSGFLGQRADDDYMKNVDLVLLDIKSGDPDTYRKVTGFDLAPTLRFAERLNAMNKAVWVRFVLVPGLTDARDNIRRVAEFVAPMKNVQWVEVLPFHQMGAFKWKSLGLDYKLAETPVPTQAQIQAALEIFHAAGCRAR
ncbi:pyruvate formate lyase-activating protein [Falsiroseomonas bella]|uniref:Pyruvate formate-lyase-activating enzyme n=2 Tax=Falsiroseomonas bella TaxID=2184016 RepID=A0A317FD33_9PROT|nr:pyruvate formate lyase-activating protein [Falsiroseomonas bella]